MITIGKVPFQLKNKIIYSISMSVLVAGTKYRGEFEEKIHKLIKEVLDNPNVILFIDEIHTLMGAGGAEGAIDASNIFKPYLARGQIRVIGATTINEYSKSIENDKAFDRRFQKVYVEEATYDDVFNILMKLKPIYENYHHISISDLVISSIVDISFNSIFNGRQPDKAIDLLDQACSYAIVHHNRFDDIFYKYESKIKDYEEKKNQEIIKHNFKKAQIYKEKEMALRSKYNDQLFNNEDSIVLEEDDLFSVIYDKYRINPKRYHSLIKNLKIDLKKEIYGQDNVIDSILSYLDSYNYITNDKCFSLFLIGKSGVGKTFLVDKLIKKLFLNTNYLYFNMLDYQDSSSLSKFIGTSPGYVGYHEDSLFDSIKNNPFTVLFFDHFDKSHSKISHFILDSLEKGFIVNSYNE